MLATDVLNVFSSMPIRFSSVTRLFLVTAFLVLAGALPSWAQQFDEIPRNEKAERIFDQAVAAFERGDYEQAADRFRLVNDYPLNRKTTAALVMEGKAHLQLGRYQESIDVLDTLLERYPETSYREEGERLRSVAQEQLEEQRQSVDTLRLGVALPMADEYVGLSQAMFNGIRLAVDEHNGLRRRYVPPPSLQAVADSFEVAPTRTVESDSLAEAEGRFTVTSQTDTLRVDSLQSVTEQEGRPDWVAKMYFREVYPEDADSTRMAIDSLTNQDEVDAILGPLFSKTARVAGEAAQEAGISLIAPLATSGSVSAGKTHVFQANPTIPLRGRIMARFVSESLLTDSVGIFYERDDRTSARIANGFRKEAEERDLDVVFTKRLDNARGWSQLPETIEADSTLSDSTVRATEALYLPISGVNASGRIQDALTGVGRLNPSARILGNSHWHNLTVKKEASTFTSTYATDFNVQTKRPEVQDFIRQYRLLSGNTPDNLSVRGRRLAYTGYDISRFLLTTLSSASTPRPSDLRGAPTYDGLGVRINFRNGNVNRAMFFMRYRNNRIERIR